MVKMHALHIYEKWLLGKYREYYCQQFRYLCQIMFKEGVYVIDKKCNNR